MTGTLQPSLCTATCRAFLYSNGTLTNLGLGYGEGINDAGTVVGITRGHTRVPGPYGFVYNNGATQYIMSGLTQSGARGINASGQVAGVVYSEQQSAEAVVYSNGALQQLGTLGSGSDARAINANGEVVGVGYPTNGPQHAFLYADGHIADLNSLDTSSPLATYVRLTEADAINDNGWIVADGVDSRTGQEHADLIENPASPVPLPSALWMMLSGICGLGAWARRRPD